MTCHNVQDVDLQEEYLNNIEKDNNDFSYHTFI